MDQHTPPPWDPAELSRKIDLLSEEVAKLSALIPELTTMVEQERNRRAIRSHYSIIGGLITKVAAISAGLLLLWSYFGAVIKNITKGP